MIKAPIIIDNGSGVMKAGLGGDEKPTLKFNTYVGRPKYRQSMINAND
jgi:centractin